jgi:hypothetical protein
LRKLEIVCAARKSAALVAQTIFTQRNRCADCAGKFYLAQPLRWLRNEILLRKSNALDSAANFNGRNRCAGCAAKIQRENPKRWIAQVGEQG